MTTIYFTYDQNQQLVNFLKKYFEIYLRNKLC